MSFVLVLYRNVKILHYCIVICLVLWDLGLYVVYLSCAVGRQWGGIFSLLLIKSLNKTKADFPPRKLGFLIIFLINILSLPRQKRLVWFVKFIKRSCSYERHKYFNRNSVKNLRMLVLIKLLFQQKNNKMLMLRKREVFTSLPHTLSAKFVLKLKFNTCRNGCYDL